jgi:kumamolisin
MSSARQAQDFILVTMSHFLRVLAVLTAVGVSPVFATTGSPVTLKESFKETPDAPASGPLNPHKPFITRRTLKAEESAASMTFEVALKMRNVAELQARISRGERIDSAEMDAKYEPLATDYQKVVDWLTAQGFTIVRDDPHHLAVFAQGTVSQIRSALQVTFGRVSLEGTEFTSAISAPVIDSTLAPLLVGINGLQPQIRAHKHLVWPKATPNTANGGAPYYPSQIAQAYNANNLYGQGLTGAGQSIAIVIDTFPATSDLVTFWKDTGVNQSIGNISFIQVVSGTLSAPEGEETLDTEWSSSIAPQAKVRVYATVNLNSNSLDSAYNQIYSDVTAHPEYGIHQMSMSYGGGETYDSQSQVTTDDNYFSELAAAGVTIFASSGDGGSTPGNNPNNAGDETGPLQVESPASDPYVTGVGGTTLVLNSDNSVNSESVWNNGSGAGGGGVSIYFSKPSWQTGSGVPSGGMRYVPDLSCSADPSYGAFLVLNGGTSGIGGTSWSSPTVAGFCALLNQARSSAGQGPIGLLNSHIYSLIGTSSFRDIVGGTNATANSNGLYVSGPGYDEASGVGVPLVQALGQSLVGASSIQGVAVQPTQQMVAPGQNATLTATAGGSPTAYQWQVESPGTTTWANVTNSGTYGGATSATLGVSGAGASLSGNLYRCVVTYGAASITSAASTLIVDTPLTTVTVAGRTGTTGTTNGTGTSALFNYPSGVVTDGSGNIYVADFNNNNIREISPAGVVSTPYGSTSGTAGSANGTGNAASFNQPNDLAIDSSGNLYVADSGNNSIRKIVTSTGAVSTLASGFKQPQSVRVDASGTVFVADTGNDVIRKIATSGTVSTVAGRSGFAGYVNASGTSARFNQPQSIAVDGSDNIYVADFGNEVIRKITSAGAVSTYAGTGGVANGTSGNAGYVDGPVAQALFNAPNGLELDAAGNLYVTDALVPATSSTQAGNDLLRKITPAGVVSTLAGQPGVAGSANGTGTGAEFYSLQAAFPTSSGEVFLADTYNQLVRAAGIVPVITVEPMSQVITVGQPVTFSVTASGSGMLSYQWTKNGSALSGATGSSYTISSVAATDAGDYAVTVTDPLGSVSSGSATLVPVSSQPMAQTVPAGNSATFAVSVAGSGGPFSYQWLFNGAPIAGATSSTYTIANVTGGNAGNYSVMVTDSYGTATTMAAMLTVGPAAPVVASDTPTMPAWGMVLLGAFLILASLGRARSVT